MFLRLINFMNHTLVLSLRSIFKEENDFVKERKKERQRNRQKDRQTDRKKEKKEGRKKERKK